MECTEVKVENAITEQPKQDFITKQFERKNIRILLTIFGVTGFCLVIALTVALVTGNPKEQELHYNENCNETAEDLLNRIDTSIDPCEDFYEYSCRKGIINKQVDTLDVTALSNDFKIKKYLEEIEENDDEVPESVRKISKLFKMCSKLKTDDMHKYYSVIENELNSIGGWPMVTENWEEPYKNWSDFYATAFSKLDTTFPIQVQVFPNPYDTVENIFYVAPNVKEILNPSLENVTFEEKDDEYSSDDVIAVKSEYIHSAWKIMDILSVLKLKVVQRDLKYEKERKQFFEHLNKLLKEEEEKEEVTLVTIEELNKIFPSVDWLVFFNKAFNNLMDSIVTINKKDKVVLQKTTLLSQIIKDLDNGTFNMRLLSNVAVEYFLKDVFKFYSQKQTEQLFKQSTPVNETVAPDQWRKCIIFLYFHVSPILDYLRGKNQNEYLLNKTTIRYFLNAKKNLIEGETWLDDETKKAIYDKLDFVVPFSGYPKWTQDPIQLEKYYNTLPEITDNPIENHLNVNLFLRKKYAQKRSQINDRDLWPNFSITGGSVTNAFYVIPFNQIVIPAGMQAKPFFSNDRPMYITFGSIGSIISHESTHALDENGSKRDRYGNLKNWWTNSSKAEFDERLNCLVDQYNKYELVANNSDQPVKIDGEKTLSENVADNGGIRQAFLAYKMWVKEHGEEKLPPCLQDYDPYKLFFISYAQTWCSSVSVEKQIEISKVDTHSPNKFRIIGSLANMKEFSEVFNCKVGSAMNPEDKCVVW